MRYPRRETKQRRLDIAIRAISGFSLLIWLSCLTLSTALAQTSVRLPQARRVTLTNGMKVILVEQHEVPIISLRVIVKAGSILDPPGKEGLANLTAQLLRRGTSTRTGEKIADEVDFVGGTLEIAAGHYLADLQAEFLKKDIGAGLEIVSDILRHPAFPIREVSKIVEQEIDAVLQEKDEPESAIEDFFDAYLFGKHPYARPAQGDELSISTIRRPDVVRFYQKNYIPSAVTLVVAGDFTSPEIEKLILEKFDSWKVAPNATPVKLSSPQRVNGRKLLLIDKPDATQTFFLIGNVGVERTNPDRIALLLVNTVFGGRFTSMLNDALRVNSGLTYGASADFDMMKVAGPFSIAADAQNGNTTQAIDLALDVLKKLHTEGLTAKQLESAKHYLKGQFPPQVETSAQLAQTFADLDFFGLDESEVNNYFARLDAISLEDTRRIIDRYYPLDDLVFVLIGKAAEIRSKVQKYALSIDQRPISKPGFN